VFQGSELGLIKPHDHDVTDQ